MSRTVFSSCQFLQRLLVTFGFLFGESKSQRCSDHQTGRAGEAGRWWLRSSTHCRLIRFRDVLSLMFRL